MKIEEKLEQLTELMANLIPAVDKLVARQEKYDASIADLVNTQHKTNAAIGELRQSNMNLAHVIENFSEKTNRID